MSHLTKTQRSKFLNGFSTRFVFASFDDVQLTYLKNKKVSSIRTYKPKHVPKIRGYCQLDKKITLTELVNHLLSYTNILKDSSMLSFKGQVKHTVEYLESEGFLRFLPDTDGELTFCNYKYFYEIYG